jgi:type I restriction enzyme S subunit
MSSDRWIETTVRELAAHVPNAVVGGPFGSNLGSADYVPNGVPVIRGQNLALGRWIGGEFVFVSDAKADALSGNVARPGDLVFTQRGTLGQVAVVPNGAHEKYLVSQSQMKLTADPGKADVFFLYYVFISPDQQDYVKQNAIQTGVPHTNLGMLRDTSLRLPPLDEQRRIAGVLGALDDKIESNQWLSLRLDAIARIQFSSWFADWEGVDSVQVGELISAGTLVVGDGYRAKNSELDTTGIPFLRGRDVGEDIDVQGADLLSLDGIRKAGDKVSRPGDAFFTAKGTVGRIGRVTNWTPQFVYSPQIAFWRVLDRDPVLSDFVFMWLRGREFLSQRDAVKGQTDMADYVNLRDQREMRMSLPPSRDRARAFAVISPILDRIAVSRAESRRLARLRDALVPKLVSGQIRVSDDYVPNDLKSVA